MRTFPSRMLFRPVALCPRLEPPPRIDGDLADWEGVPPLPDLGDLDGEAGFAQVRVGWREDGLYLAYRCPKPEGAVVVNRRRPHAGDGLQVWIDTRATQDTHRASRFCHHFILLPRGGGPNGAVAVARQVNIRRAREHPLLCDPARIQVASVIGEGFYTIEAHLPADVLHGFEGHGGARLGFNYLAHDIPAGRRHWSAPGDLPVETDPSLWGLLELAQ